MKELDLQNKIIREVKEAGGHGRKWATSWQNGVPDLILIHPMFGVIFAEVKLIEVTNFLSFSRKIHTTELQRQELSKIRKAGGKSMLLVGVQCSTGGRLYKLDPEDRNINHEREGYTEWKRTKIVLGVMNHLRRH